MQMATALTAYTPGAVSQDVSQIAITAPLVAKTIVYGNPVMFCGTLLDSGDNPIPNRRVYIELKMGGYLYIYVARTDTNGLWSVTLSKALRRNLSGRSTSPAPTHRRPTRRLDMRSTSSP